MQWICLALALCSASTALAEEDSGEHNKYLDLNLDLETLLNIKVTTASKFEQTVSEAPGTISVITHEQIERYGWRSINDILYKLPGFGPGQDYDRPTVPTRGSIESWNANHILHLVDGIPMNTNLHGSALSWEITPLTFTKSIEILRGPGSALYGSSATSGVVQVNTIDPDDLQGHAYARLETGSMNTQSYDLAVGQNDDFASTLASFHWFGTSGNEYYSYDGSGRFDANGNLQAFKTRDERSNSYFFGKLNFHQNLEGLMLQYHQQQWEFDTGHGWLWWIPDFDEAIAEYRHILALKYQTPNADKLSQEYVIRYQRYGISWNQRYYPNGAFSDYYPDGMWEYLKASFDDIFLRAQYRYAFDNNVQALMGFELDRFLYTGDDEHYSNINVDSEFFEPFPNNRPTPLGPHLDYLLDKPLLNHAVYAQISSGQLFGDTWQFTAGARDDHLDVNYRQIYVAGQPESQRTFSHFSPRLAAVCKARDNLTFKLLWGQAFRVPSPSEMGGAHTFALASNIEELQAELLETSEVAMDWEINHQLNLRANFFNSQFDNLIAYSTQNNNLSTNVFSQTTSGIELELLFRYPTSYGSFSGFANWSYVSRPQETVVDNTITEHDGKLTWSPAHKVNLGLSLEASHWQWALTTHYQDTVQRRDSDKGTQELPLGVGVALDMDRYRGSEVPAWFMVDTTLSFLAQKSLRWGLKINNLLDKNDAFLVKSGPFPFDYRQPGRATYVFIQMGI